MKKILWAVFVSMVFLACSDEKEGLTDEEGLQIFELNVINKPTRGVFARSRPWQNPETVRIGRVKIYVFQNNGADDVYLKTYNIPDWPEGNDFMNFTPPDDDKLAAGDYKFLVVGQGTADRYTSITPIEGTTKITDMMAMISMPGEESEIFTGLQTAKVTPEGIRVEVQMTRRVASVSVY